MFPRARSEITAGGGRGTLVRVRNFFVCIRVHILPDDVFLQLIIGDFVWMNALQVSAEVVRSWPYLLLVLTCSNGAEVSASSRVRVWVATSLVPLEVVRRAETFTTLAVRHHANMGLSMSLFMFPRVQEA